MYDDKKTGEQRLSEIDRQRLAKLLGLLGSSHAGERDAAGLAAHRFVQQRGMSWANVLEPQISHRSPEPLGWRQIVADCLDHPDWLTDWEIEFLVGLLRFPRLSVKQHRIVDQIASRILERPAHCNSDRRG